MSLIDEDDEAPSSSCSWSFKTYIFIFIFFIIIISSPFIDSVLSSHKIDEKNLTFYGVTLQAATLCLGIFVFNVAASKDLI